MTISFSLPKSAQIVVKPKDEVKFGDELANVGSTEYIKVNLSEKLGINPQNIFKYLLKIIGEEIKDGDVIAQKKSMMFTKRYISEYDGKIKEVNHNTGEITLEVVSELQTTIHAPFTGEIEDIKDTTLKIKIAKGESYSIKEGNIDSGGEVYYYKNEGDYFTITETDLQDKVVCIEEMKYHIESKCEALGCSGFIFLKGDTKTELPYVKLKDIESFKEILKLKKKYSVFSVDEKKLVVYD